MKDIKVLFLGDIHCREFWIKPVYEVLKNNPEAKIVFIGDYLDGYSQEWDDNVDYAELGFEGFLEIIKLKEQYKDRTVLLLGNHDATYAIGDDICKCRTDYKHKQRLEDIFQDKRLLFQLAYSEKINDIDFLFTHAGVNKKWVEYNFKDLNITKDNLVDFLNNMWLSIGNYSQLDTLGQYDNYRGYFGWEYGSPIWADIKAMYKISKEDSYDFFQIVGHSQLIDDGKPLVFENIGDFDCRAAFYIDSEGKIRLYDTDEVCEKIKPVE